MKQTIRALAPATALCAMSVVHAQQEFAPQLEEVVVTAQKRSERLLDVPSAVTALRTEDLLNRGALRFEDYQAFVPGLSTTPLAPGFNQITLRGVSTGDGQLSATVATYFDEAPTNSSSGTAFGSRLTPDPDVFDVERIEVLRGPQGTLFGANALGGVVRYILVEPDLEGFEGRAQMGGSSVQHGEVGYVARGALGGALIDGVLGMRASGFYTEEPGYIDGSAIGGDDVNRSSHRGGRLAFLWKPDERISASLSSLYQRRDNDGFPAETVNMFTMAPIGGEYTQTNATDESVSVRYQLHSLMLNADLDFATLTSATSYGRQESEISRDYSNLFSFLVPAANTNLSVDLKKFTQELRLASPSGRTFEYIVGAFYTRESALATYATRGLLAPDVPAPAPLDTLIDLPLESLYEETALFANATVNFTDRLSVQAGGRWSRPQHSYDETPHGFIYGPTAGTRFQGDATETAWTFAVSPQIKLTPDANLYARIAKGFRPGAANLPTPDQSGLVPVTYGADTLLNYEVGAKATAFDRRLNLAMAIFLIDWQDVHTSGFAGTAFYLFNGGKARSQGFEGEAQWRSGGLTLAANVSYIDAETRDAMPAVGAQAGDRLPNTPQWSGALSADYAFDLGANTTASIGGGLRYTDTRQAFYSLATASNPGNLELADYALLDLRASLRRGPYELSAFVQNVTDKHVVLAVNTETANPFTGDGAIATIARPRTVGLTLSVDF